MPKNWYSIKAAAEGSDVAEVSILDYIGGWGVDARSFLTEFRALKANTVKVFINSPGGSVFEALAIFNGMRATGKTIEIHVLGVAASAASYIAMAGDKIVMPDNTYMFVHNPINAVYGNADDMREMADVLDKIGASLTATYAKRWKGTEQELADTLKAETYLTAAECLERGLCDEVTPAILAEAAFDVEALPEQLRAVFKRAAPPVAQAPTPVAAAEVERIAAELGVAEHVSALALDPRLTTVEAVRAAAAEAAEIVALCRVTGSSARAASFIAARQSYADVRSELRKDRLAEGEHIDTARAASSLNPPAPRQFNPAAMWQEINQTMKTGSTQ